MLDNTVLGFVIVALIGFFIISSTSGGVGCFTWCDAGKVLLMWGLTELAVYAVKGGVMPVKPVGVGLATGGEGYDPYATEEPDQRGLGDLVGVLEGSTTGGGMNIASSIVHGR